LLQLVYYGYLVFSRLAQWLPERFAYGLAHTFGTFHARRSRGKPIEKNLARITGLPIGSGALDDVVAEACRSYARYWLETFRVVRADAEFFRRRVRPSGHESVQKLLDEGSGAVLLIGHLGNWDAAGAWAGSVGWKIVTVAEPLRPRRMFDFFVAHRARLGLVIYPARTGVTRRLAKDVDEGAVVPLLADRDLKGTGVALDFFGEPATFPRGAASLALRCGVPLVFAGVRGIRLDDGHWGWAIEMSEPLESPSADDPDAVDKLTATGIRRLEEYIRRYPTEWHVFQPFWPADRAR
jgi:lauroyl/myristoyl acyltransferase